MCFPAVQKFWESVKIWQSYREFEGVIFLYLKLEKYQKYTFMINAGKVTITKKTKVCNEQIFNDFDTVSNSSKTDVWLTMVGSYALLQLQLRGQLFSVASIQCLCAQHAQ